MNQSDKNSTRVRRPPARLRQEPRDDNYEPNKQQNSKYKNKNKKVAGSDDIYGSACLLSRFIESANKKYSQMLIKNLTVDLPQNAQSEYPTTIQKLSKSKEPGKQVSAPQINGKQVNNQRKLTRIIAHNSQFCNFNNNINASITNINTNSNIGMDMKQAAGNQLLGGDRSKGNQPIKAKYGKSKVTERQYSMTELFYNQYDLQKKLNKQSRLNSSQKHTSQYLQQSKQEKNSQIHKFFQKASNAPSNCSQKSLQQKKQQQLYQQHQELPQNRSISKFFRRAMFHVGIAYQIYIHKQRVKNPGITAEQLDPIKLGRRVSSMTHEEKNQLAAKLSQQRDTSMREFQRRADTQKTCQVFQDQRYAVGLNTLQVSVSHANIVNNNRDGEKLLQENKQDKMVNQNQDMMSQNFNLIPKKAEQGQQQLKD